MPDNWSFVLAAYGLTAIVLALYWHRLVRKEKEIGRRSSVAGTARAHMERARQSSAVDQQIAERSRQPSSSGHPRPDPTSRGPRQ